MTDSQSPGVARRRDHSARREVLPAPAGPRTTRSAASTSSRSSRRSRTSSVCGGRGAPYRRNVVVSVTDMLPPCFPRSTGGRTDGGEPRPATAPPREPAPRRDPLSP
ncbi:Uncharacterised protein [Mycobacteroides abscessus]|nr:Uncharacterised protein [Mycobacteroides abscessus]